MTNKNMEQLKAAMQDKNYVKELMALETIDAIQAKFAEAGIDLTAEEVETIVHEVVALEANADGELSEEALESVAGGGAILGMAIFIGLTAAGVYIGWKAAGGCNKKK